MTRPSRNHTASARVLWASLVLLYCGAACRFDKSKLAPCIKSSECDSTFYCDRDAGLCLERLDAGESCAAASDCVSGYCVDGVCCASGCTSTCRACNLSDKRGVCADVPAGQDPGGDCTGQANCGGVCNGSGACAYADAGTVCGGSCAVGNYVGSECSAGACTVVTPTVCGLYSCNSGGTACNTACAGHSDCNTDAGYCEDAGCRAKKAFDAGCNGAIECVSGWCAVGTCL